MARQLVSIILTLSLCCVICNVLAENGTSRPAESAVECSFQPDRIDRLIEGDTVTVYINCTLRKPFSDSSQESIAFQSTVADERVASVVGEDIFLCRLDEPTFNESAFTVQGLFLGRTVIKINPSNVSRNGLRNYSSSFVRQPNAIQPFDDYQVSVIREVRIIDHLFMGLVTLMVICANIGMGCKIELKVVKEVLTKPIAPVIGFCCQYILMPLTAFAVIKLFGLSGGLALGFFAAGCAPGGGSSNMYTFLLGGDVSLSVTMTLVSTLASLGMIPLWLFTLGKVITKERTKIQIPFANIMISLACILIPVIIGVVIQRYCQRASQFIIRLLRPFYIIFILCMFTFGVWSNLYIFKLISPLLMLAGCLLPYVGFGMSALVAFILRQPPKRVLTIAIETGIQNTGLAIILMKFSLPQPEADLAIVSPIVVAMFMPLPLWIAVIATEIRRRCIKNKTKNQPDVNLEGMHANGVAGDNTVTEELLANKKSANGVSLPEKSAANGHNGNGIVV